MEWQFKPSCCVDDHGLIDRCTTFKAEPFDEDYFNGLDLENHKACTDYKKYGTDEETNTASRSPTKGTSSAPKRAARRRRGPCTKRMRGAADTGIICTDFTLDPDPIKACTWQQAALGRLRLRRERPRPARPPKLVSLIAASDSFDPSNREVKPDGCAVKIPSNHRECFIQQNSPIEFGQLYEKKIRKLSELPPHAPSPTPPLRPYRPPPTLPSPALRRPVRRCQLSRHTFSPVTPPGSATVHADGLDDRADPEHAGAHHRVRLRPLPVRADYNEFGFSYHEEVFKFYDYVQKEYVQPAFNMDSSTVIAVRRTTGPIRQARMETITGRIGA